MMLWILFFLSQSPARAETPHVPAEMQQKVQDISAALRASYAEAQRKMHHADESSDIVHAVLADLGKLWSGAKAKGRGALLYLDHQLHAHLIGADPQNPQ